MPSCPAPGLYEEENKGMTNLMKLSVIALLTGTLALVGCGDDATSTGGTGGSGGTGGTAGAGGAGGAACETTCGVGNTIDPAFDSDEQVLNCTVMGIGLGFQSNLTGQVMGGGDPVVGPNTYSLQPEAIVSAATANLVLALADSSTVTGITATVVPTAGTTDTNTVDLALDNVPCLICFERDTEVRIVSPAGPGTWDLNDGTTQTLTLQDVTIELDASGLALVLETRMLCSGGDNAGLECVDDGDCAGGGTCTPPDCVWDTVPPSLSFTAAAAN